MASVILFKKDLGHQRYNSAIQKTLKKGRKTMRNHFKKIMAMLLCIAMSSTMGLSAYAADISAYTPDLERSEQFINKNMLQQNSQEVNFSDNLSLVTDGIMETVVIQETMAMAANQPPVAELQVAILNPESMINGKFTTETQIAWLWSYNGQDFTYDPDGDEIADIRIGGISSSDIIGTLTGNIGFATQFKTATQYVLTFQVQDSQGAWSNIAQYAFSIEPADGNTRPICKIGYSTDNLVPNQVMLISWANSTDSDSGDSITSVDSRIIKDGVTTSLIDYLIQNNGDSCYISFPETGTYQIWLRVSDSHNAWSDWVIISVTVESVVITNVSVNGSYSSGNTASYWVDNYAVKRVDQGQTSSEGVKALCEEFGSHDFPSALPSKQVFDSSFSVSGRALTASGSPVANTRVVIQMSLPFGKGIYQTLLTDSNGYFSYNPTSARFWVDAGYNAKESDVNFMMVGDVSGQATQYIFFSSRGTSFFYPTSVTVSVGGQTYSEQVTCEVGYSSYQMIGNSICINGQWGGI